MANWHGAARSNYVHYKDLDGLKKSLEPFGIDIHESSWGQGACLLVNNSSNGGWPGYYEDADGNEHEFLFEEHVCPFMQDDQILITMMSGHEKLRYITGAATAYNAKGEHIQLDLAGIYKIAAARFKVKQASISSCSY